MNLRRLSTMFTKQFCRWIGLVALLLPLGLRAGADWDPQTGWQVDMPALEESLGAEEARWALDQMNQAREAQERGRLGSALRHYRRVTKRHAGSTLAAEAHFQSGVIRKDRKQWNHAFNQFQSIIGNHPDYPGFDDVIRHQFEIAHALQEGARLRLFWVIPGFRSRERAVEYHTQLVENAPFSDQAPISLLHAADIQVRRRQLDEAIDLYDRFISEYPSHEQAPDAFFGLANAFSSRVRGPAYDQGATREAMGYFDDFTILHPTHPRVGEAEQGIADMREMLSQSRIVLGDFFYRWRNNLPAARVFYNEAITLSPASEAAGEARERLEAMERREQRRPARRSRWEEYYPAPTS